jgi:hypothetical protein
MTILLQRARMHLSEETPASSARQRPKGGSVAVAGRWPVAFLGVLEQVVVGFDVPAVADL